ncbi:serine/threonine protein kinase [Bifidobacterium aemilianum]|uniref:non-specific serine/threonine protein kinase n=1 Tax=Bifidobacterium aemilianum TaxID=2493120 RepID=A0A366K691_9BIFI|nr:serine/threonine-protein kinase [Bifidobacterium aemilianum]RBP97265.1 serine/threonine protein kinase [Bifidobacterium aemilianum]
MSSMSDLNALDLQAGEQVGGYRLVSRLGGGAMGSVWRVSDEGGQVFAMKILRDSLKEEAGSSAASSTAGSTGGRQSEDQFSARERLRREAMALKKVRHPGVCDIVDMELDDALAFIVTELIEGKNLRDDVQANGPYQGDDLERLASKLIDAVQAVHQAGIIHRDIKPTNVMVSTTGPVLVDFGIAMGEGESHVTRTGLVMGTPGFIAPEIIEGSESSEATDWWSLASVLAFAATGKPVFGSKPLMAVLEREASGNADLTGLPAETLRAFRQALDPDPGRRCSPLDLLTAISRDALNPLSNADEDGQHAAGLGQTLPFDPSRSDSQAADGGQPNGSNPRTLWDQASPGQELHDPSRTRALGATATLPMNSPQSEDPAAATRPMPSAAMPLTSATRPLPASGSRPLPAKDLSAADTGQPQTGVDMEATETWARDENGELTQVLDPNIRPALQHFIDRSSGLAGQATVSMPAAGNQPPAYVGPPEGQNGQGPYAQAQAAGPVAAGSPGLLPPPSPNPAALTRARTTARGRLPLALMALPLGLLAAWLPLGSLMIAALALWLLLALGLNMQAQLRREEGRGGLRKGGDAALRLASLPWHLVKALALALPRALLGLAIWLICLACTSLLLGLPLVTIGPVAFRWLPSIGLPASQPLTRSGLTLALVTTLVWLLTTLGPKTALLRLGAGSLRPIRPATGPATLNAADPGPSGSAPTKGGKSSGRGWILFVFWLLASLAALVSLLTSQAIDWAPLTWWLA